MSALSFPYGGREIAELRSTGKRPADMVLLSLIGPLRGEVNPVVIANPARPYDWRFLRGLDVLVVAHAGADKRAVQRVAEAVKAISPEYLGLWFADLQNGLNCIVGGVEARPRGLLRYMGSAERESFAGLGIAEGKELVCA